MNMTITRVKYGSHVKATSIHRTRIVITESSMVFLENMTIGKSNKSNMKAEAISPAAKELMFRAAPS
jgi:hypothetical protein